MPLLPHTTKSNTKTRMPREGGTGRAPRRPDQAAGCRVVDASATTAQTTRAAASFLAILLVLPLATTTPTAPATGPPPLSSLTSAFAPVRTCSQALPDNACGPPGLSDARLCQDLGCCMVGSKCLQPGDATTPPPWAGLQRYAASQAVPSLANGVGQLQADHTGDILGISCLTIPRELSSSSTSSTSSHSSSSLTIKTTNMPDRTRQSLSIRTDL